MERGAKGVLRELKFGQDILHLSDGDASTALRVRFLQRVVQLHLLEVHLCHIDLVEEDFVLNAAYSLWIKFLAKHFKLSRRDRHATLGETSLELSVREQARTRWVSIHKGLLEND